MILVRFAGISCCRLRGTYSVAASPAPHCASALALQGCTVAALRQPDGNRATPRGWVLG